MTQDEKELNKKIARWLGFSNLRFSRDGWKVDNIADGLSVLTGPTTFNFTRSMDTCLEYVVPTLDAFQLQLIMQEGRRFWRAWVFSNRLRSGTDTTAPLAFCRAVEKLIDGEGK